MTEWMPEAGERLFFISTAERGNVHVHFIAESTSVGQNRHGDVCVELELKADGSPILTEAENLAVAILRKDELAALPAADDVLERFRQPEGFIPRGVLMTFYLSSKSQIEELRQEVAGAERNLKDVLDFVTVSGLDDELVRYVESCRAKRLKRE